MTAGRQLHTFLVLALVAATVPAGMARAATEPNDFKTDLDKVSYIIGAQIAGQIAMMLRAQDIEVNMDMFVRGLREGLTGQKPPLSPEEQAKVMIPWQKAQEAKAEARKEELRAKQEEDAQRRAKQEEEAMAKLGKENEWKLKLTKPELREFDPQKEYLWILETNKGNIRIRLMPDVAPMHVTSTIFLTEKGFYDGTTFHRVIPEFMAQGGCPVGDGRHGPGYQYAGEIHANVRHDRPFLLSMANAGPNTDGSQFFITFKPTPWLDGKHTIFGEVVDGQDTVEKLEAAGSPQGTPKEELKILKARIEEKAKG
jgi:peptidyl-prolyl cis-trans isomerase B (cyclophilin B)